MKKVLLLLFIAFSLFAKGQVVVDDTTDLKAIPNFYRGAPALLSSTSIYQGWYYYDTTSTLTPSSTIFASDVGSGFWRKIQITGTAIGASDTAAMLQSYLQRGDTASMLQYFIERSDTAAMLLPYISRSDTATMLNGYARQKAFIDSISALRGDIGTGGGVSIVSTVSELASADTTLAAFWTDTLRGGLFFYYTNPLYNVTVQDSGMAILPTVGSGAWVRYATGALRPEWFGAKGDGITEDHKAINDMLSFVNRQDPSNYVIEFRQGRTYLVGGRIAITNADIYLRGNDATIKRADIDSTSLKYQASNGQNYVVVNNPNIFKVSDQIVVLKNGTDQTSYNHSAYQIISSIVQDTLFFTANLADNNPSTPAGAYAVGSMVYKSWDILEFAESGTGKQEHTTIIENLNFDGNKDNWPAPLTWTIDQVIDHDHFLIVKNCKFINSPSDCIIGNVCDVQNSFFQNNNASAIHFSYSASETRKRDHTAYIKNNVFYDNCQVDNDHSEGVIVWSAAVGNVRIENNYVDTSAFGFLGNSDASTVGNIYIINNVVKNTESIHQIGYDTDERKEIHWESNKFTNCGRIFYQYLTDSNNVYLINNEFHDSCQVQILRGGSINIQGNLFRNNYSAVTIQESHDLKFYDNTLYNTSAVFNLIRNQARIERNSWFNESSNNLINSQESFLYVGSYFNNYGSQRIEINNNLFHENNDNSTGAYRGIYLHIYNTQARISNNRILKIEKPIRIVNTSSGADSLRMIMIENNEIWCVPRTSTSTGTNNWDADIILENGCSWRNNWMWASKEIRDFLRPAASLATRKHFEFTGNTVWSENNGMDIIEGTDISDQPYWGLWINNIYNGSVLLGDYSLITSPKIYTVSDRNLNLQITPNMQEPKDFVEWQ